MVELVPIAHFETFAQASARARYLATEHERTVSVMRSARGWSVLAAEMIAAAAKRQVLVLESEDDMDDFAAADSYQDEVMEEIRAELSSETDAWARSEEEGWFYGDED